MDTFSFLFFLKQTTSSEKFVFNKDDVSSS